MKRWRWFGASVALALSVAWAGPEDDRDVEAFLGRWAAEFEGVQSLRVEFTQSKSMRMMRRLLLREGQAWVLGERFRMVLRDPTGAVETEVLVADGEARMRYPQLDREEVFPADADPGEAPLPLFGGDVETLGEQYRIELVEGERGEDVLILEPLESGTGIVHLRMALRDYRVVWVEQETVDGTRVRLDVQVYELDPTDPPVREGDVTGEGE